MTLSQALARFNDAHGTGYAIAGGFTHGEVGAMLVRDGAGTRAVAKWVWPAPADELRALRGAIELVERLRERGARVPAYLHLVAIEGGVLVVQEHLPGVSSETVTDALIGDLLDHNRRQAELAPDGDGWRDYLVGSLREGLGGYCEHASLRAHSSGTRGLLARIRAAGAALRDVELIVRDAVHRDFHHLNVLQADGRLSGVVDCEGMRSGDRIFDLVTLAFCLSEATCPPDAEARVWREVLAVRDRVTVTAYVAHMALRQVDWSIRHRSAGDVQRWLARSEAMLHRFA